VAKKEIGEIIQVDKGGGTVEYKARLPKGAIVVFSQTLIQPARMTLLTPGARVLVEHDLGRVVAVSTNLSQAQTGVVTAVKRRPGSVAYVVDIEQGGTLEIAKDKIQPHPNDRPLLIGAVLDLQFDGGALTTARLVKETDVATITSTNLGQNTVSIVGKGAGGFTVRLAPEEIRQVQIGDVVDLEIAYTAEGKRKLQMMRRPAAPVDLAAPVKQAAPVRPEARKESPRPGSEKQRTSPGQTTPSPQAGARPGPQAAVTPPSVDRPPSAPIEAETFGLDLLMFEQVKRAGHRQEIVAFIEKHARDGLIEWYDLKAGRPARTQQPARPLPPQIQQAIQGAMPEFRGFFQHQALALDAIRHDRNLVIVTQTASGKTLSYNPAIFEYLLGNPQGHVLYVFPLNALMMDQLEKIHEMIQALEKQGVKVSAARMMGGMSAGERDTAARECPNIVVTNPEMLNYLLDRSDRDWRAFFAGLKLIVIDEVHSYRGIFGVHMTGIVRRLLITARRLGADPRFVISSATVNNPLDLASRLTALPQSEFFMLDPEQDGSQQADKHWLVLNPDWGARSSRYNNYQEVAAEVFVEMLLSRDSKGKPSPLNTILFCRSMREVRAIKNLVDQRLDQRAPHLKRKVKSYISANLTTEVKREIYNGLRSGDLLGVISTNALEAGIDIGSLDACIIAGFPFSVMALRQMAGRVGRKKEGLVCFIPFPLSSLDQYYSDHPDLLLTQPPEEFVVDPHNPYIARKHINAAAYPTALSDEELIHYWGQRAGEIALQAQKDRVMFHQKDRWMGTKRDFRVQDDVYQIGNIRSNVQVPYVVCRANGTCSLSAECFDPNKRTCESRITLLDQQYVYRDCHPGAVYESPDQGLFRILSVDDTQRMVKAEPLPDDFLERTFVEADIEMELNGEPRAKKQIIPGVEMAWGSATVTRLFTGYQTYTLQPARRCRRCRKEFDETIDSCPTCRRPTERFFNHSKQERKDFPPPYEQGFRIVLKTVSCWLTIQPQIEAELDSCSPCRLPGDQNRVMGWLKRPLDLNSLPARLHLTDEEKKVISEYHKQASQALAQAQLTVRETLLFPGIYGKCLLSALRRQVRESRALELYQALTGYPVTDDLRHVCRNCRRSVLLPAMHTLEHAVDARYPSVALGDRSDIGALTTLGHPATGLPTIFWFDNYEGGLGAAEKIYELILRLLETGRNAITSCTCTTIEGCPRCTYIPDCGSGNADLSKPAGILLISKLLGSEPAQDYLPFLYKKRRAEEFDKAYKSNEMAASEQGVGEEAPAAALLDPYQVLRLQRRVHTPVVNKAFEVRSREIVDETPPLSAEQLNQAFQAVTKISLADWQTRPGAQPYEVLEVLPSASLKMIQQIYRVIALHIHPDANPAKTAWANELMKQLNAAYDAILKEKNGRRR
jgi:ATP-dependent helicase YprA (DUF1998 family)